MSVSPFLQSIHEFVEDKKLLDKSGPVIVGVGGGSGSIALLHVLKSLGYSCIVCHCNFNLRGEESLRDRNFTRQIAFEWNLPFEEISFDASCYAMTNNVSVEMACRQLRYDWFEEKRKQYRAQAIAVAHHLDDSVETLLLNLIRGTGIAGLTSMKPRNGFVVRPLLTVSRKDIESYLSEHGVSYVVDCTNLESVYIRNKIRLQVLPLLRSINPSVDHSIYSSILNLREVESVYKAAIHEQEQNVLEYKGEYIYIPVEKLKQLPSPKAFLFEFLTPYGFVSEQITEIISSCGGISGKGFLSRNYRIVKDREYLILEPQEREEAGTVVEKIESLEECGTLLHGNLLYRCLDNDETYCFSRDKSYACFDLDKLVFPLIIRRWETGDRFTPFGMKGSRKLSDYFRDRKYSLIDKANALLLCSGNTIIWILGERAADGYRVTADTKRIIEFKYEK